MRGQQLPVVLDLGLIVSELRLSHRYLSSSAVLGGLVREGCNDARRREWVGVLACVVHHGAHTVLHGSAKPCPGHALAHLCPHCWPRKLSAEKGSHHWSQKQHVHSKSSSWLVGGPAASTAAPHLSLGFSPHSLLSSEGTFHPFQFATQLLSVSAGTRHHVLHMHVVRVSGRAR
jgi:hypothetical protein